MTKTMVEIPETWERTKDGRYKFETQYDAGMGRIEIDSIPDCVSLVGSQPDSVALYSNEKPDIPKGLFLVFSGR